MLRHKIRVSSVDDDANINIGFKSVHDLGGLSQDVENLISKETDSNINPVVDEEKRRFTPSGATTVSMYFYSTGTTSFVNTVAPNEFTVNDILTQQFRSSFYVYKIFDSPFENNQNLVNTGYVNGFSFTGISSTYVWNNGFEYTDIHIPLSYLNNVTAITSSLYLKMNFYSGKSGKIYPFSGITTTNTELDQYATLSINKISKTYTTPTDFRFKEIRNQIYVDLINDSIESLSLEKPTYPSGNTFTTDGYYVTN